MMTALLNDSFAVVPPIVVAIAVVAVAAVVVGNTNHVERGFGSIPVEMQRFVDLGYYTSLAGGFAVAPSEDLVVASE